MVEKRHYPQEGVIEEVMTDTTLRDLVLKRLDADTKPEDDWSALVLAALEGPDELDKLLDEGQSSPDRPRAPAADDGRRRSRKSPRRAPQQPRIAFLKTITVEGFRGIGPKATLDLTPGPGLTLVVGRNGSGKSSFAEALELLLTGDTYRWAQRSKVWRDGWRNLHHPKAALAAEFALEGEKGACTVAREWADGADLDAATTWAQVHGKPRTGTEALGWETPLDAYRPFLSYNELGSMLDEGPSKLYDALSKVLGLDALVDAQTALQQARSTRDKARKDADQERKALLARLEDASDERAAQRQGRARQEGLGPRRPRSRPRRITDHPASTDSAIDLLQRLAALQPPDPDAGHRRPSQALQRRRPAPESRRPDRGGEVRRSSPPSSTTPSASTRTTATATAPCAASKNALDEGWHQHQGPGSRSPPTGRQRSHRSPRSR